MDLLKIVAIGGTAAILIALGSALYIALENASSRNIALATGALAGATILFAVQVTFELRGSREHEFISTELTVDRAEPSIRQFIYGTDSSWRLCAETGARKWLAENKRESFDQSREKLTSDMILFSLLSVLGCREFDWQLERKTFGGATFGQLETARPISRPSECSTFTADDLQSRLSRAGNLFAGGPIVVMSGQVRLPPKSRIDVTPNSLVICNPVCQVSFEVEPSGACMYVKPGSGGEVPHLPEGGARFETRVYGLQVETTFFGLRAQHRDIGKYRKWASRLVSGAREWFESAPGDKADRPN